MPIDFMDVMKSKVHQALYSDESMDFTRSYDNMMHLPLSYYIPWEVVCKINKMVTSLKYADKISYKKKEIINLLHPYGFRKFASGTNRITLSHIEDHSFLIKVALDNIGMRNNPDELVNSHLLKPFMPKVFDVTPCGTIALVERVLPITCLEEAKSIAPDIFNLIVYHIIGKYVAADIGTKYYMNWGVRYGFGPVILDLTDLFELDGKKLYCNWKLPDGSKCGGEIDYDAGFNNLVCNKCHHIYEARQLAKQIDDNDSGIITIRGGNNMAVKLMVNNVEVARSSNVTETILTRASRRRRPIINDDNHTKPFSGVKLVVKDDTTTPDNNIVIKDKTKPQFNVKLKTTTSEESVTPETNNNTESKEVSVNVPTIEETITESSVDEVVVKTSNGSTENVVEDNKTDVADESCDIDTPEVESSELDKDNPEDVPVESPEEEITTYGTPDDEDDVEEETEDTSEEEKSENNIISDDALKYINSLTESEVVDGGRV